MGPRQLRASEPQARERNLFCRFKAKESRRPNPSLRSDGVAAAFPTVGKRQRRLEDLTDPSKTVPNRRGTAK